MDKPITMNQPRYFPFMHGVYDVKAGITALGRDCGNGDIDRQVFQFDQHFDVYRACKQAAHDRAQNHILRQGLAQDTERCIGQWVADRLCAEHPTQFTHKPGGELHSNLTGECIPLNHPALLDALAMQVQEDLAVLQINEHVDERGGNTLSYLNVAMPSGWSPEEKIGKPFDAVHRPVPHIEAVSAKQNQIAKLMVNATRGAVRFAWTITTDTALNHHPKRGRNDALDTPASPLHNHTPGDPLLRVERQVIWGFPKHNASLFTIRTYLYGFDGLDQPTRAALAKAVAGMSEESLRYKSMDRDMILAYLNHTD